jgi:hypothetical protein
MNPLWKEFPSIPWGSIGWRMGWGEAYANQWSTWYESRSNAEREAYKLENPEPPEWNGFYSLVDHGTIPPWKIAMREEEHRAGKPPESGEEIIREAPRIRWLVKNYLARPKVNVQALDERFDSLYVDPSGYVWGIRFDTEKGGLSLIRYRGYLRGEDNLEVKQPIPT